jgi:hypothetical protein
VARAITAFLFHSFFCLATVGPFALPRTLKIPMRFLGNGLPYSTRSALLHLSNLTIFALAYPHPRIHQHHEPTNSSLAHSLLPLLPSLGNRRSSLQLLVPSIAGRVLGLPVLGSSHVSICGITTDPRITSKQLTFSKLSPIITGQSQYHGTKLKSA